MRTPGSERKDARPTIPLWGVVGGGALLAITALAAPFYAEAIGGLAWAAEALKALCGW